MSRLESVRDALIEQLSLPRAIALTGALGAGKTVWALDIARSLRRCGRRVAIADLDIINPYFCVRDVAETLEKEEDIRVVLPPEGARWIDLPVLSSVVTRVLADRNVDHVILDVGGEAKGVLALKQFAPFLCEAGYWFLMVVNPFRPQSSSSQQILALKEEMQELSGLKVSGMLGNPHLMDYTTVKDVSRGLAVLRHASEEGNLPLHFCGITESLYESLSHFSGFESVSIWPISRMILFPWERGVALNGKG